MPTILVTAASGQLGRLTVHALLERGVDPADVIATARDLDAIADLAALGVTTRRADYDDRASLDAAFAGVDRLLFVSSNAVGQRDAQHTNVVDAAVAARIGLVAYTSILRADTSSLLLAEEHLATEKLLAGSGLTHVLLRNGMYIENLTDQLPVQLEHGVVLGAAGDGRISGATRADFAAAAAAVLAAEGEPAGATYELGGPGYTLADYAAVVSGAAGRTIGYQDLAVADLVGVLAGAGLPEGFARVIADIDRGAAAGELLDTTGDLERLLGRPATPLVDAVAAAVAALA